MKCIFAEVLGQSWICARTHEKFLNQTLRRGGWRQKCGLFHLLPGKCSPRAPRCSRCCRSLSGWPRQRARSACSPRPALSVRALRAHHSPRALHHGKCRHSLQLSGDAQLHSQLGCRQCLHLWAQHIHMDGIRLARAAFRICGAAACLSTWTICIQSQPSAQLQSQ